jgi:ATP-dependent exoDNAse (exonuclease V), alpha subunit - helicase superfamily I member
LNEEQDTQYEFEATVICERYFNEDSSWGVYVIDVDKDKFNIPHLTEYKTFEDFEGQNNKQFQTILAGNTVQLFIGQKYKITARLKLNTKYRSWQYEPISVLSTKPKTQDEQQKFLESIVTKNQAKTLIENYPNIVDDIINGTDNIDISKLYGIGKTTYAQIKNKILDNFVISDILVLLQPLGITFNMIKKLLREEPNPALLKQKLIDNPYIMTRIKGFGFKTVDTLALKLNPNIRLSKQRTYAFITYYLKDIGENVGHTWVRENILESAVIDNINECIDIYHDIIKLEKQKNVILYFNNDKVGLAKYHELESNIFNILVSLNNYNKSFEVDIEDGIQEAEKEQGFKFSDEQNRIIEKAFENNVTVISGRAGTGKTSISRAILKIYNNANYRIGACALSAKAAQRITEATGFPASTIHRMLSWQGEEGFTYNHFNPLPYDVILLDEASMVNVPIFYALLSAIKEGSRVIVCGDDKQLPPIGYGNVFGDLIQKIDVFNVNQLTHVHRQAEKSGILSDANKIREGVYPIKQPELKIVSGELKDMVYMFRDSREALRNLAIKTYLKSIQEDGIDNVVIITPRKQNCINSTAEINRLIQNALISKDTEYMKYGDKIFKLGSKVIQRENNYDKNVFNGEIGYITKIWNEGKITKFRVNYKMNNENKTIDYTKNELDQIDLAYAMTVHLCVPKNTYIYTNKGLIEIDKLNNTKNEFEYNPIKSDIEVFNGYNLEQPSYFYNAGKSECKTIKTERGFELTATLDHGVNVINQNFEIIRKQMSELTTNDYVLLRHSQNIFGNIKEIPKQYFNIEVDVRANKHNLPKVLTKDFARFLGYIVADGTIYEKGFRYSKRDLSTVQDFKRVTDSVLVQIIKLFTT